jgi:hypothetical protein
VTIPRRPLIWVAAVVLPFVLLVLAGSIPGCVWVHEFKNGTRGKRMSFETSQALREKMRGWLDEAETIQTVGTLRDLLDVDEEIDTVHVFFEGASEDKIRKAAGVSPVSQRYYDPGSLLLFMRNGELVRWVSVIPILLVSDGQNTWPASTRLVAGTGGLLQLVEG